MEKVIVLAAAIFTALALSLVAGCTTAPRSDYRAEIRNPILSRCQKGPNGEYPEKCARYFRQCESMSGVKK